MIKTKLLDEHELNSNKKDAGVTILEYMKKHPKIIYKFIYEKDNVHEKV